MSGEKTVPAADENDVLLVLDDEWASVSKIRSRIGPSGRSVKFASILERMADAGMIDRTFEVTNAAKWHGKPLKLSFYRRRPESNKPSREIRRTGAW